jgi:hypothetical protein
LRDSLLPPPGEHRRLQRRNKILAETQRAQRKNAKKKKLKVLAAVFEVSNTQGAGFLEKVYQRALLKELGLRGIPANASFLWWS